MGIVPQDAELSRHDPDVQDWEALPEDVRDRLAASRREAVCREDRLAALHPDEMTPLEALSALYDLKALAGD